MASAGLREELECSICLSIYTDPVTLRCGHNFCRGCIDRVLDTQEWSGGYSCPKCRGKFQKRPPLQRNITLCNIVENFLSTQPGQEESQVSRTCDPTTSCENRKCSIHKDKLLEYYCVDDASCICVSCSLAGEHRGHQVDTLNEASKKMKCKLRSVLQEVMSKKENTEKRIQNLDLRRRKTLEKAASETERLTALFRDLRRCLEDLERRVLTDISRQTEWMVLPYDEVIRQLEVEKDDLSKKIQQIEMLCNMTDALTIVQTSVKDGLCGTEEGDNEDTEGHDKHLHDGRDLDVASISCTLHRLSDILTRENVHFYTQVTADISLDVNTAHNELEISDDWKMASKSEKKQNRPKTQYRFQWYAPQQGRAEA
ncbi:E3 ubiquitin-protein ligase TRIM11-like [Hyperolius riggenbachi]|uniref:E3 ubiquitin-protein ligase TRIM11-like n=1 Tax=Hyperolius riggenbachi TaxID=752182 RepID=UPI0035A2D67C